MLSGNVLIVLLGVALLIGNEQEKGLLQTVSVSLAAQPNLRTGQVFRDGMKNGTDGPEMIVIPSGKFRMGDIEGTGLNDEQPVHVVHIRRPIAVSRYEITFDQYDEFAKATGRQYRTTKVSVAAAGRSFEFPGTKLLNMPRGYRSKQGSATGCRQRPNGNMQRAAELRLLTGGATR